MKLGRLSVPARAAEDVRPHLQRSNHWKAGYSAHAVAHSWMVANDIPAPVRAVLEQVEWFRGATLVDAFFERQTDLQDGCGKPSQSDVLAVITSDNDRDLSILLVEAKVREPFGKRVDKWLDGSTGKVTRLAKLCELLRLDPATVGPLRYQLLHRAAAAIYEAQRYRRKTAAFVVQSFCPDATGLADYQRFAEALGYAAAGPDRMTDGRQFGGVVLMLGWVGDVLPESAE